MASQKDTIANFLEDRKDDKFIRVNLEWLTFNRSYDFDLYIFINNQYVLLCRKKLNLTEQMTKKIKKKDLFIDERDSHHFQAYMEENISDIIRDSAKPIREKSEAVYTVSTNLVNDLLNEPKAQNINKVKNMVDNQLEFVMNNPGAVNSLMSITEHDYYTYTHSMNVAIYLVGLGGEMKMSPEEIKELSLGGMLHDLGKAKVPLEIINSTGKLTEEEFTVMKKHPEYGVEILRKLDEMHNMVPKNCYYAILHHHERFVGGGYPEKKVGKEIHLYGRMTKVCDVFDALTTKRSYKEAMTSFDALVLMKEKMADDFDSEIFEHFLRLMADYSKFQRTGK